MPITTITRRRATQLRAAFVEGRNTTRAAIAQYRAIRHSLPPGSSARLIVDRILDVLDSLTRAYSECLNATAAGSNPDLIAALRHITTDRREELGRLVNALKAANVRPAN